MKLEGQMRRIIMGREKLLRVMEVFKIFIKMVVSLEIELPYDPAIPLLGIYLEETRIEKDTCTPMFLAVLFTIARMEEPGRLQSMGSLRVGHD